MVKQKIGWKMVKKTLLLGLILQNFLAVSFIFNENIFFLTRELLYLTSWSLELNFSWQNIFFLGENKLPYGVNRTISEKKVKWNLGASNRRLYNVPKTSSKGPRGYFLRTFSKGRPWEVRLGHPWDVRSWNT